MINFKSKGDFSNVKRYIEKVNKALENTKIDDICADGIIALREATPIDTGKTASSWYYMKIKTKKGAKIEFRNSNIQNGVNVAILLQYGHGTKNGGYVQGRDYINPALKPIFERILNRLREEVK